MGLTVVSIALSIISLGLLGLCGLLFIECFFALLGSRPRTVWQQPLDTCRRAILIPAHNEAAVIKKTLLMLKPQLLAGDRLVVVADNCTDQTAAIARGLGATVLERQNFQHRGKGYALDFGLRYLAAEPPDLVVMLDADCCVQPGALAQITAVAIATHRPVQSTYLLEQSSQPTVKERVSTFAFKVKNRVRPAGLRQLGQPCLLTGTGMAFPWACLQAVDLASGNIVEDMKLGLDLAIAGYPPIFCASAQVLGQQPETTATALTQRTRWEHGHLQTLLNYGPKLLGAGLRQRRLGLLALAFDLCIPPLALLTIIWLGCALGMTLFALLSGAWLPAMGIYLAGGLLLSAVLLAWGRFGRADLPLSQLLSIPFYILWKVPLYFKFLVKPEAEWVRTARN